MGDRGELVGQARDRAMCEWGEKKISECVRRESVSKKGEKKG